MYSGPVLYVTSVRKTLFLHPNPFANRVSEVPINLRSLILNTLSIFFLFSLLFLFFNSLWGGKKKSCLGPWPSINLFLMHQYQGSDYYYPWPLRHSYAFSFSLHPLLPQWRCFTGGGISPSSYLSWERGSILVFWEKEKEQEFRIVMV